MYNKLLFGGLGAIHIFIGGILALGYSAHAMSFFAVAFVSGLLASGVLKILPVFVVRDPTALRQLTSGSFLLDGLLFVVGYQFFIEVGTYEAQPIGYALAAGSALTMSGIGIYILRGQISFPN